MPTQIIDAHPAPADDDRPLAAGRTRPVKVIYILGWGHSGSTLLDMIIGSSPNVASVGEIIFFNYYRDQQQHQKVLMDFACTCGEPFAECSFWQQVLKDLRPHQPNVIYDASAANRFGWLSRFAGYVLGGRRVAAHVGDDDLLLRAVADNAGPETEYICDSSKDFARLVRLLMNPKIEVYPVHLVRDVRAVAYSYTKKVRDKHKLNKVGYVRAMFLWTMINLVSQLILRMSGRPYLRVSYQKFCEDPQRTLRFLNQRLGLSIDVDGFVERVNQTVYHDVGGNWMRFEKLQAIRTDDAWRQKAPRFGRWLGTFLFGIFNWLWVDRDSVIKQARLDAKQNPGAGH